MSSINFRRAAKAVKQEFSYVLVSYVNNTMRIRKVYSPGNKGTAKKWTKEVMTRLGNVPFAFKLQASLNCWNVVGTESYWETVVSLA